MSSVGEIGLPEANFQFAFLVQANVKTSIDAGHRSAIGKGIRASSERMVPS
jgi:hypothetical protein